MTALRTVLEEKLVKRGVSLKGLDYGKVEEATQNTVRQVATLDGRHLVRQGARDQQADQVETARRACRARRKATRCGSSGKKRDDLQAVITMLKGHDLGVPLQFINFRD